MGSFDWRLEINAQDLSVIPTTASQAETGAFVALAARAHGEPVYFSPGQGSRIVQYFGAPSFTYPDIQEALDFNQTNPIWVSSPPNTTDSISAILLTTRGSTTTGETVTNFVTNPLLVSSGVEAYTFDGTTDFVLIGAKCAGDDELAVNVTYNATFNYFDMSLKKLSGSTYVEVGRYEFSLDPANKDAYNQSRYIDNVLGVNDYITYKVNTTTGVDVTQFTDDTTNVALAGGARTTPTSTSEIADLLLLGWAYFQDKVNYRADIFMDGSGDSEVINALDDLTTTYQKYTYAISMLPDSTAANAIILKNSLTLDNPNMALYWNRAKVNHNNSYFVGQTTRSLIGRIGRKYAAMQNVFDGLAPSYIDEDGHGGQLGLNLDPVSSMLRGPTDAEQASLDAAGLNPLILDYQYGPMTAGQRTAKDPTVKSDYSWVAHARLFNYIIKSVIERVLVFQVTKLNDPTHRFQAQVKTEDIIKPILSRGILADAKILCNEKNNTPTVLQARKFVLSLAVKVTPFSEFIQFNFINVGQLTDVQTVI